MKVNSFSSLKNRYEDLYKRYFQPTKYKQDNLKVDSTIQETNNSNFIEGNLNDLYKKYFQNTQYKLGDSFDSVKTNMSAEDYDISQKLLNYYIQQNSLTDQYDYSNKVIEQERDKALQENSIAKQKAMKYLPEYLKLQGIGGLGLSESSVVSLNNDFVNNRNTINSNANAQKADLLKNYQLDMNSLNQNALEDTGDITEKYRTDNENAELERYNTYIDMLKNKEFATSDDVDQWFEGIKGSISEDRESIISGMVDNYKDNLAKDDSTKNLANARAILDTKVAGLMDYNGKISQASKSSLYDYIESNYKDKLSTADYETLKAYIEQYSSTTEEEEQQINDQSYVMNNYGITSEGLQGAIALQDAGVTSFGAFKGSGNGNSQDELISNILEWARRGNIKNGDVIDFNYGKGTNNYLYYNGYFYPTTIKANDQSNLMNKYGLTSDDLQGAISLQDADTTSFGSFKGSGNGKSQDNWISDILSLAKQGKVKDGDIVDFNYGEGTSNYLYYNGYWYPTKKKATINYGTVKKELR